MEQQMKDDYNAITWAWKLLKDNREIQENAEYWENILNEVASHNNDGIAYQALGSAVLTIVEYRERSIKQYGDEEHAAEIYLRTLKRRNEQRVCQQKKNVSK